MLVHTIELSRQTDNHCKLAGRKPWGRGGGWGVVASSLPSFKFVHMVHLSNLFTWSSVSYSTQLSWIGSVASLLSGNLLTLLQPDMIYQFQFAPRTLIRSVSWSIALFPVLFHHSKSCRHDQPPKVGGGGVLPVSHHSNLFTWSIFQICSHGHQCHIQPSFHG